MDPEAEESCHQQAAMLHDAGLAKRLQQLSKLSEYTSMHDAAGRATLARYAYGRSQIRPATRLRSPQPQLRTPQRDLCQLRVPEGGVHAGRVVQRELPLPQVRILRKVSSCEVNFLHCNFAWTDSLDVYKHVEVERLPPLSRSTLLPAMPVRPQLLLSCREFLRTIFLHTTGPFRLCLCCSIDCCHRQRLSSQSPDRTAALKQGMPIVRSLPEEAFAC